MNKLRSYTLAGACLLALGACSNSSDSPSTLTLSIMDGPIESAEAVVVEFSGVVIKPAGGDEIEVIFDQAKSIDLLQLQNGNTAFLLENIELEPGRYNWIHLMVNDDSNRDDTYITVAGVKHELTIPSSSQTGLKLISGFDIDAGGNSHFTIDFDLRKSVVHNVQGYKLKPTLRLVDNSEAGHIAGTVDATVLSTNNCGSTDTVAASVYVFSGSSITPDDVGSPTPPLATSNVVYSTEDQSYRYKVAYLPEGDYTVALTCEASVDDAEANDDIAFVSSQNVSVSANSTQTADF